ncbi:MAG TPA: class II aldolase/adducin family protein [Burkholderiales bacterium]|jgi:ribulose-5-phosphate 4-epimerase/fuculose-1-phosphate aldolase|nr:class II aldolase/adducin family protein [Burkholderiales bacterium]
MTIYLQTAARPAKDLPMTEAERKARVELAACYRIFDMLGWTEMIFNHITLRVPGPAVEGFPSARFLINPFGLHYREITASSLVLIDLEGNALRETKWPVNRAGFVIHSAIHGAIPQAHCVMHTHTTNGVAVSCLKDGLSSHNFYGAMLHGRVAYHELQGVTVDLAERESLVRDLGDKHVMILRNHGLLSWGRNVAEAYLRLWTLQRACDVQVAAGQAGGEVNALSQPVIDRMLGESGPGETQTCEDVYAALVRLMDARDPSYRD